VSAGAGAEEPLRVLLACDWFVKYTAGLASGLQDDACEVAMLTRDHDMEFGDEAGAMRAFAAAAIGAHAPHWELGGRVRDLGRLPELRRLRGAVRRWRPDVVHVQDSLANDRRLGWVAGLRRGGYALTVHDPVPHPGDAAAGPRVMRARRVLRGRAGLVFVHSEALADELRATGDTEAPIEVVPHGVEPGSGTSEPPADSLLFFGRISHYKGLDVLLDAMPAVWTVRPTVNLVIAGDGPLPESQVLDDPRVDLRAGYLPEDAVPGMMEAATCLVLPYRQASQSGVGSQARQFGRAVIASAVGGLPDLVSSEWGRLVPPEDPAALAAAILELVGTPGLAAEMGARAAATLGAAGWDKVGEATIVAYRRYLL
jgi:glycosyltransferase involved in cell wall biosynthesis